MTPVEEQILRNHAAIMGFLSQLLMKTPADPSDLTAIDTVMRCVKETGILLKTESQQGRTVHAYPAS